MRKIFAIFVAMAMCAVFAPLAGAADHDTISVTLTPGGTAHIDVYNTSVGAGNKATWLPVVSVGGHTATTSTYYTLENTGSIPVNATIKCSDTTTWTLETAAGHNQFNMSFTKGAGYTLIDSDGVAFVSNLAYDGTQAFGLQVYMPTSTSTNTPQSATVTFTATVA